jgi:hypothetical protein
MALDEYNLDENGIFYLPEENNFPDNPYSEDYDVDEAYDDD